MTTETSTGYRAFGHVLVNTAIAGLGTGFIWFAATFWAYLETRSVLVTSIMGGAYMLGMAVLGVPLGGLVDRYRKHRVMMGSAVVTVAAFGAAATIYLAVPTGDLGRTDQPWFWLFVILILAGALVEMVRNLALSTCVTILVPSEKRANANGMVGTVAGATMLVVSVLSGLAIGQLGLGWSLLISLAAMALSLLHLAFVRIPEPKIVHAEDAPKGVDFRVAWTAVIAVPGLLMLVLFSTFNNFLGGVFMGLLDPYGLELMSVEAWGILFGVCGLGFLIGGGIVSARGLGGNPLRMLLLACMGMWVIAALFAIRASILLLAIGLVLYMALVPIIEAAEQTMLQRVVPLAKQGRVFGFAQAVEVAAAPVSAFVIGPVAEYWLIPYARSPRGRDELGWLLGDGPGRGIALVFVVAATLGLILTAAAFATPAYRRLRDVYAAGDVNADVAARTGDSIHSERDPEPEQVPSSDAVAPLAPKATDPEPPLRILSRDDTVDRGSAD